MIEGGVPPGLRDAIAWSTEPFHPDPWMRHSRGRTSASAASIDIPAPEVIPVGDETSGGRRHLRLIVRPVRGSDAGMIAFHHSGIEAVRVNGVPLDIHEPRVVRALADDWVRVGFADFPAQGYRIDLELSNGKPVDAIVMDESWGLPAAADALVEARPPTAVPSQSGDRVIVQRRVRL